MKSKYKCGLLCCFGFFSSEKETDDNNKFNKPIDRTESFVHQNVTSKKELFEIIEELKIKKERKENKFSKDIDIGAHEIIEKRNSI